jgi:23S rRNA (uracil1939-C5)-methyltransferase
MADTVELEITDVAFGGAGVARHEGKVCFVPFTAPGDRVRARLLRDRGKFANGEVVEILTPSPDRVAPRCPYFMRCGGCAYQHIAYERQLALKQQQVAQTLRRVGRLADVPMHPIVPSPVHYEYRNRIRVHVESGRAGFFAHGSHELIPIERCAISQARVNDELASLRKRALADGDYTLVAGDRGEFFEQTNDAVAAELLALVGRTIRRSQQRLIDAYCGAGFFAHALAPHFEEVVGIEENEYAVAQARRRAGPNERHIAGDVGAHLGDLLATGDPARTSVILDPPATGIPPRVLDLLIAAAPSEILHVSCNPATLARDLAILTGRFRLVSVTPLDMFPQTAEIEVLAVLQPR